MLPPTIYADWGTRGGGGGGGGGGDLRRRLVGEEGRIGGGGWLGNEWRRLVGQIGHPAFIPRLKEATHGVCFCDADELFSL
jgi:hypothetical protein